MSSFRIFFLTVLTMMAFAGNSVLCRIALKHTTIDAASFTSIRLVSGALVLLVMASFFRERRLDADAPYLSEVQIENELRIKEKNNEKIKENGNWISAFALFVYAAGFSFAYVSLSAATGALILFGAVQATMIGHGLWSGERFNRQQLLGLLFAFGGLIGLLLPGLSAPPLFGSMLMVFAGLAWGVYSLRGKGAGNPTLVTTGNFIRAMVFSLLLSAVFFANVNLDLHGVAYSIASGALASGVGYTIWYAVLPSLKATNAATVQLSVPVIAAFGGITFLNESVTLRFVLASIAILGGIALVIVTKQSSKV
jgi:drug/metabolite transporter (DMT)-like permease